MSWDDTVDNIDQGIDVVRDGYDVFLDARDYINKDKEEEDSNIDVQVGYDEDAENHKRS